MMISDELVKAALSVANGLTPQEAMDRFCEQIAQQKPAQKIACETLESFHATLEAMEPICAAYAHSIGMSPDDLTDTQKKQAMLNWLLAENAEKVE